MVLIAVEEAVLDQNPEQTECAEHRVNVQLDSGIVVSVEDLAEGMT